MARRALHGTGPLPSGWVSGLPLIEPAPGSYVRLGRPTLSANRPPLSAAGLPIGTRDDDRRAAGSDRQSLPGMKLFVRERGEGCTAAADQRVGRQRGDVGSRAGATLAGQPGRSPSTRPGWGGRKRVPWSPHPALRRWSVACLMRSTSTRVRRARLLVRGHVAQQLARQAPERVRRMALVGTSCGWGSVPRALGLWH